MAQHDANWQQRINTNLKNTKKVFVLCQ